MTGLKALLLVEEINTDPRLLLFHHSPSDVNWV